MLNGKKFPTIELPDQTVHMEGHVNGVPFFSPTEKKVAFFIPKESFFAQGMTFEKGVSYWLREGNLKMASNLIEWPVDITVLDRSLYEGMTHGDCTGNPGP